MNETVQKQSCGVPVKTLTVFLSMKGETINPGMKIINLEKGYTNIAAEYIQAVCGGDLFEIVPERQYDPNHMKMIFEAKEEFENNARPAVKNLPESIEDYQLIYLCFPNWWATMPMPVFTFLEHYDWNGKVIAPLVTSGGSGFANALEDLKKMCPGAVIREGLEVLGHETENSQKQIENWAWKIRQEEEMKVPVNVFDAFDPEDALHFMRAVLAIAEQKYHRPVSLRVTLDDQIICQYAGGPLAGLVWLDRKEKTVRTTGRASIELFWNAEAYPELKNDETQSPFGGGVPYIINGENRGAFIVTGLRHREDHDLAMAALAAIRTDKA